MSTAPHLEAGGLLLIADESLSPVLVEQAAPVLAQGGMALCQGPGSPSGPRRLVLFDGKLTPAHAEALRGEPPALLLATRASDGRPSPWETRLLGDLLRGAPLLPAGASRHRLQSVADINATGEAAAQAVTQARGSRTAAALVGDVVHELAANAMWDAPVDAQGQHRYAHRRSEVREVAPEDACELSFVVEEGRMWLEVVDRFGGLRPGPFARALGGWGGRVQVDASGGGAGLGLRRILEHSDVVAVRVAAGRESRVLCVVDLGEARRRATQPKSLLFCLQ
ncbi:hypothetical protein MXAN_4558 [Myxococcus xanthus DK 1622]|uniref:Uncharacterized protein n=2 Tax=Myxococcus xanthus TaxID=34 RepID=Q1D3P7_MYXXD|nr:MULTISPECIES: hypothetical protein [Myxococcus]ABF87807.1 hypothetical protein MXAN_4558 [Myxococcus xanthus DK 1622]NOJ53118.1 hypothetical protein [Myxococcus xanthus]QPM77124.1 hypothetical protein I5Q59_22535 [Myxococcus xanthus]QVW66193.1 hypothetical protein JTM82_27890 [Myxococcus xanthus DZ2]QZZ52236.1 hypothetical protein MyxoNM_23780 [Myxococcus xanthus]